MSNKGYAFESSIEKLFLRLAGQSRDLPLFERVHRIPSSGAMRGAKGDILVPNIPWLGKTWCIEAKHYRQGSKRAGPSYRFQLRDWRDIERDSLTYKNAVPIFAFRFKGTKLATTYYVLPAAVFTELADKFSPSFSAHRTMVPSIKGKLPHVLFYHTELKQTWLDWFVLAPSYFSVVWPVGDSVVVVPEVALVGLLENRKQMAEASKNETTLPHD